MVISPEKSAVVVLFINIFKFVRFYLVLYIADFSGDIMFCERDLVRERDLVHLKPSIGLSGDAVDLGRVSFDPAASLGRVLRQTGETSFLCSGGVSDGRWVRGGGLEHLTAVVHRRAGFLRPSPSVSTRGLRCLGCGEKEREWGGGGRAQAGWGGGSERDE